MATSVERGSLSAAPINLGDFLPDKTEVQINGRAYTAWVYKNFGLPRRKIAMLARAKHRWLNQVEAALDVLTPEQAAALSPEERAERAQAIEESPLAYSDYLTEALLILVEGLDEAAAEMVSTEKAEELLIQLGYFNPPSSNGHDKEAGKDAAPLIGATSPPDSLTTTPDTPTNDS